MSELHPDKLMRLYKWSRGAPSPPWKIDLEPTYGCNLKCVFCWTRDQERLGYAAYRQPINEQRLLDIVDEAAALGVREWQVAGGWEPMIKPKLSMELMLKIKRHGMYGCLTTNGTLFQAGMAEQLVRASWDQILFSIEGPTAEIHDTLVGRVGAFDAAVAAMTEFKHWMEQLHADVPRYSFHTVINSLNYHRMDDMIKLAHDVGCFALDAEPITIWNQEFEHLRMNDEQRREFEELLPGVIDLARSLGIHTNLRKMIGSRLVDKRDIASQITEDVTESYQNPFLNTPCFEPWLNLEIRASGHVVPCRLNNDDDYVSVHNASLHDIWYGEYFQEIRQTLMEKKLPGYCSTCAAGMVRQNRLIREKLLEMGADLPFIEQLPTESVFALPDVNAKVPDEKEIEKLRRRLNNQQEQTEWLEREIMKVQGAIMNLEADHQSFFRLRDSRLYQLYALARRRLGQETPRFEE